MASCIAKEVKFDPPSVTRWDKGKEATYWVNAIKVLFVVESFIG